MPITVTIRQGVAALGGLLAAVGLAVLLWPVGVVMDGPFGLAEQVSCGSALVTHDSYGGPGRAACAGALGDQRTFGWPLLLGGLLVAGTALLHARHPRLLHPEDRQRHTPRPTPRPGEQTMPLTITPRQFAATIGVLAMIAGLIALSIPVSVISDSGLFGASETSCGNALLDRTGNLGGDPLAQCRDALGGRRAWAWPLGIAGLVLAAAAVLIRSTPRASDQETADND